MKLQRVRKQRLFSPSAKARGIKPASFKIKRRGWIVLIFGAFFLLAALATGKEELFILASLLCLLLLAALAQAALQRPGLKLDAGTGRVVCGQPTTIAVLARNPLPWPLFPVRLRLSLLREQQPTLELASYEIALKAGEEKRLEATATCPHRGEYLVQVQRYHGEDVFGLFALAGQSLQPQSLLSLPRLDLAITVDHKHAAQEEEESQLGRPGLSGQLTAESRLYQRGDSLRTIHWKKSVGRRQLFSRLREYSADYSCCLLIDSESFGQGEEALAYEDSLCEAAMSFLFSQLSQKRGITLLPGNLSLQSLAGLDKAAAFLATLDFKPGASLACLKTLLESQNLPDTLFLLLGQPAPQLTEMLEHLQSHGCAVICLCPAAQAAVVENSLTLPVPLITIEPPFSAGNWLEVRDGC